MSVARSVADVLADHVSFEVESIDRLYLKVCSREVARAPERGFRGCRLYPSVTVTWTSLSGSMPGSSARMTSVFPSR